MWFRKRRYYNFGGIDAESCMADESKASGVARLDRRLHAFSHALK
jgi:hypothetical protein